MFTPVTIALLGITALIVLFMIARTWLSKTSWWGGSEGFQGEPVPKDTPYVPAVPPPPPPPEAMTDRPPEMPAPAPPQTQDEPMPPRVVSPSGPNPPNAEAPVPSRRASLSPEVAPIDPYDDQAMGVPIHDTLRQPEMSFGPGVENTGVLRAVPAGAASPTKLTNESRFSPEYAQNGGSFMGSIMANDMGGKVGSFAEA